MKTYTLEDLKTAFDCKAYLPKDRFMYYFTKKYGYSEYQAKEFYRVFLDFPKNLQSEKEDILNEIMPKIIETTNFIRNNNHFPFKLSNEREYDKFMINKVIYKENDQINEFIIDFRKTEDVLIFAEIIKREVELIARLNFSCEFHNGNKGDVKIFVGDVFNTFDKYYGDKSNVYLAESNQTFKRLLYTKGVGYLHKGKLNYEEDKSYSSYALSLNEYELIGNAYIDISFLSDKPIKN